MNRRSFFNALVALPMLPAAYAANQSRISTVRIVGSSSSHARTLTGIPSSLDLRDFGAVGDGKTDDTLAVQRGITRAYQTASEIRITGGQFLCGPISIQLP